MDIAEDPTLPDLLKSPIWLEIRLDDTTWLFELKAGEERAVVVGSHPRADVRIGRPGVAAMHFHFEREDDAVLLIPGYQAALRVNSVKAPEPCRLDPRATIEFRGGSLEIVTHREVPSNVEAMNSEDSAVHRPSSTEYLEGLPDETDPTGIGVAAVAGSPPPLSLATLDVVRAAWVTEQIPCLASDDLLRDELPTGDHPRMSPPATALGPQGTLVMSPVQLRAEDIPMVAAPPSTARLRPHPPKEWTTERILVPASALERANETPQRAGPDSTPTRLESPAARRSKPPAPLGGQPTVRLSSPPPPEPRSGESPAVAARAVGTMRAPLSPAPVRTAPFSIDHQNSQQTADLDVASMAPFFVTPPSGVAPPRVGASPSAIRPETAPVPLPLAATSSTAPVARSVSKAPASPKSWLALLGHAAQRSPLRVGGSALAAAVVLTLALVGASRLLPVAGAHRASLASGRGSTLTSQAVLPSAQPAPAPPTIANSIALAATPATPPSSNAAASAKGPERGGSVPADPELAQAVGHLKAGRFPEAESAYLRLSARDPQNTAYASLSRMLKERAAARCSMKPPASGCPEVRP